MYVNYSTDLRLLLRHPVIKWQEEPSAYARMMLDRGKPQLNQGAKKSTMVTETPQINQRRAPDTVCPR